MKNDEAIIVAYGRTAFCKARKGKLANTHPVDYAGQALSGVLGKLHGFDLTLIDDVIVGCAMPVKELDYNAARVIAQRAGLPESVPGQTINRFCSSSLQAIATASNAIASGQMECVVAGGVESMSKCFEPYDEEYQDAWLNENKPATYMPMGITAENVAEKYGITREEMELLAVSSHQKAHAAQVKGFLGRSIVPVINNEGELVDVDEGIRPRTSLEALASLKPSFMENGLVTAATSSQLTDAADFVVLMSSAMAERLHYKPLAKLIGFSVAGCDPAYMGLGPIYAVPKVLMQTGLSIGQMDVIELNEAFASQVLACIRELDLPVEKVNPWGGAMAIGHPLGATGGFLSQKVIDYLEVYKGRYGLVTMCVGGGMGAAGVIERFG